MDQHTTETKYASLDDFIDEGDSIGRMLALSVRNVTTPWTSPYNSYQYDSARRLTTWIEMSYGSPGAGYNTASYTATAWDSQGRVIAANEVYTPAYGYGSPYTCSIQRSYDDPSRTAIWRSSCAAGPKTLTYDSTSFLSSSLTVDAGGSTTSWENDTVISTFSVCK